MNDDFLSYILQNCISFGTLTLLNVCRQCTDLLTRSSETVSTRHWLTVIIAANKNDHPKKR